ncbi:MAG: putative lipid II flippase FtsW, partial [Gemmatimonadota bacterium]|nr:putative lipid II flippase FtsW [Gemmatimonadota bacterium]
PMLVGRRAAPAPAQSAAAGTANQGWEAGALRLLVGAALCFGVVQLYSASAFLAQSEGLPAHTYALRQLGGAVLGIALAAGLARLDYRRLQPLAWPLLGVVMLLLLLVVLPGTERIAPRVNGARRWIQLGITLQPSEFAKLALIVWTAALAVKKQDRLHSLRKGLLPFLVVWLAVVLLVFLQPNLSAALLLVLLSALVLFAGGARIGHFILLGLIALPVLWNRIEGASYRMRRIVSFLDPTADPAGASYQIRQSLIAIGSGGVDGVGFGGSQQKFGFLPEPHNDFIFAMIGEEWGLLGVVFVAALFWGIAAVGFRIARGAPDRFGYLVAVGMTNLIAVSAFLHMGVALALLPTTGVSLPFISYGRSALLTAFAAVGVLLSVARTSRQEAT